ncbi:MAG TPA: serine/threonine-protein kinase [Fimbriimonadaceae bacterium]|nr:serine/threonine-protein kinase [Fimbriimonadaceae bacterium]
MSSPPTVLGQYQIIREIARSNDIVYEAYDPQMDRRVALKELSLPAGITDAQKQDRIQRFDREAKAAGRLAHPNIMRVFQVASDGDRHYMAMEFLDGHTLRNEIDTKGFLPVDRAVEIAIAVLKGLGHAHANGVVHRDIKPDNIQLLTSGEIKITDFGIARLTFQPNLTMDGQVFGTPSYMSPEQVVGKEIDARSDLFSVGVLLYEMVSGTKPFTGDSVVAITYAIMNNEPASLNQVNHSMWQVISRALDKSPALRYASAQEMIDALEQATKQSVVLDLPVAAPPGQTIYGQAGPYPVPPPVLSPYGQPYGGMQAPPQVPPPVVYPYNPYSSNMGGAAPPHTPMYQQGFPQAPVYYPPPPRQPLLKPETKHFIGKLFLTFLVMGTLVVVGILLVVAFSQAMNTAEMQRQDQVTMGNISRVLNGTNTPQEKINQLEPMIGGLKSDVNKHEQNRNLAVLYEEVGQAQMKGGDLTSAEEAFKKANELDDHNPKLMSDLAVLYGTAAVRMSSVDDSLDPFDKSIQYYQMAADNSAETSQEHFQYLDDEGKTYYAKAYKLYRASRFTDAGETLRAGMGAIPEQVPSYRQLVQLNDTVSQYQR